MFKQGRKSYFSKDKRKATALLILLVKVRSCFEPQAIDKYTLEINRESRREGKLPGGGGAEQTQNKNTSP